MWECHASFDFTTRSEWALASTYRALRSPCSSASPRLRVNLSVPWSEFEFDSFVDDNGNDFSGNNLPGLPRHFGYIGPRYVSEKGLSGTLESVYSGRLYANTANTVEVLGYAVVNFRVSHEFDQDNWTLRPYLGINNLFNEQYNSNIRISAFGSRFFEPAPTRNLYAGIVVRLK